MKVNYLLSNDANIVYVLSQNIILKSRSHNFSNITLFCMKLKLINSILSGSPVLGFNTIYCLYGCYLKKKTNFSLNKNVHAIL